MYACKGEHKCILEVVETLSQPYFPAQETEKLTKLPAGIEVVAYPQNKADSNTEPCDTIQYLDYWVFLLFFHEKKYCFCL